MIGTNNPIQSTTLKAHFHIALFLLFSVVSGHAQTSQKPLSEGDILPELIWTDSKVYRNVHVIRIEQKHIVLKVDGQIKTLKQDQFLSLYLTTQKNLTYKMINQLAMAIGGGKPGTPALNRIVPGFILPKLVWTDGQARDLVEILNFRKGYYILRIDGQTKVLDENSFLLALQKTQHFLKNNNQPLPALPAAPVVAQVINNPQNAPAPNNSTVSPLPPPPPGKSMLEPPPAPPQNSPQPGQKPVYFDFQFQGAGKPPAAPAPTN